VASPWHAGGETLVRDFLTSSTLPPGDRDEILAAIKDVQIDGLTVARHLRDEIYEIRVSGTRPTSAVSPKGAKRQVLLAVSAFTKKRRGRRLPRSGWPSVAGTITRFESGADTRVSTVARYAAAIGFKIRWSIDRLDHTTEGSATTEQPLERS
jgi:hypothetical protein